MQFKFSELSYFDTVAGVLLLFPRVLVSTFLRCVTKFV